MNALNHCSIFCCNLAGWNYRSDTMSDKISVACPFCFPSIRMSSFFEDKGFWAIYNIAPVLPGHSLIIPQKHVTSLMELSDQEMADFFSVSRKALQILMKAFHTDAFDWSIQEKPEAGQTISHLHLHIVPRLKGDLKHPGNWYPLIQQNDEAIMDSENRSRLNKADMQQIVDNLRQVAKQLDI
jgi:bis(5'-adenosyl)-triphosphatase